MDIYNKAYWKTVLNFIPKEINVNKLGLKIIGYFPYHTARFSNNIRCERLCLPRQLVREFEQVLAKNNIKDNKAVYICTPLARVNLVDNFAILFKDDYIMISFWNNVVAWDGKMLKTTKDVKLLPPCDSCEAPDLDYCFTCKHSHSKQASNDKDNNTS